MNKKSICFLIFAFVTIGVLAQSAFAQGLLGKRYIGLEIGQMTPGDDFLKDLDDSVLLLAAGINIPVNLNVDAVVSLGYGKIEGEIDGVDVEGTTKTILGGIKYHFTPDKTINPFIGILVGVVSQEAKFSVPGYDYSLTEDEDEFSFTVGSGVEFDLNDKIAIMPSIAYSKIDDEDDFIASISLSIWFNESFFGGIGSAYAFDDGDVTYSANCGIGF